MKFIQIKDNQIAMILYEKSFSAENVIKGIGKCQCVSFDIFDTLVKRCVADPADVFVRVASDYKKNAQIEFDENEFIKCRVEAGKSAAEQATRLGREERTLDEIYQLLYERYGEASLILKRLEIEREISCCKQNREMKKVYDWCLKNGKRVFISSDMYLPQEVIETILKNCGYTDYERLFLSSVLKKKKYSRNLYLHVINAEPGIKQTLIHIGDNLRTDYLAAKRCGLKAIKIPRKINRSKFERRGLRNLKKNQYNKIQNVIGNFSQGDWNSYFQYGFECIGPMLYGFTTWLHKHAKNVGCEQLFFLSRDGYLMQLAYNMIFGKDALPNKYLYASRKSLFGSQVWIEPDLEDILKQETPYHYWNVNELCEMLDINKDYGREIWQECGISQDEKLMKMRLLNDDRVKAFFAKVKPVMVEASKKKFNVAVDYLSQENFKGHVGIVDVGWAGAIQKYLQRIFKHVNWDVSIYGFYLGLKPLTVTGPNAESYIPQKEKSSIFCSNLMEYPFTKEEGSTKGYRHKNGGTIEPILGKYEFDNMDDKEYTHEMQQGAMCFLELMDAGYGAQYIGWEAGYHNVKNLTKHPRLSDVRLFGRLSHVNHGQRHYLAKPKSLIKYLLHPHKLKMDLADSGWKIGFLRMLCKIPFPYGSILSAARRDI